MSKNRARKKLQRAFPGYGPGGSLMYVPAGQQQGTLGQTFYGSKAGIPTGASTLFSPGQPLPAQPGVNPNGQPIASKFPVAYNTYAPTRSFYEEMPSFEQLRRLAIMDYGITLCERYWLDMVPQMTLKIGLKQEYIQQGAEEKDYQKEIGFFRDFFSNPDGQHNIHEWIQQALVEQSQIDELYIYKNRTRGGKLLELQIVAGDQMKPLLDDWGRQPGKYAYQQYPWGIPGWQYTADQMIHKRETPQINTPYGRGRVERVLLITNTSLRKQREDLTRFTENNIPAGMMEVPESLNWTPDQIDAYEQSWNALIAGNLQQLVRIKFTQPGMKYVPFVQPSFDTVIDRYWLNIRASVYGVPMDELGFTDTSNRSVGEIQQDVVYRRTIGPHAKVYAATLTDVMNHDFPPELHGEMFDVSFGGYEEQEDDRAKASTLTMYTNAGVLGLSAAAKIANLPEEPGAPQIGRVYMSKDGPVFLDDLAQPAMRKAQQQATLAGYKQAVNPQQPGSNQQVAGGQSADSTSTEDELDSALDEADKSVAQLSRSDPVHGYHGEFGFYSSAKKNTPKTPRTKSAAPKAKNPKAKVPAKQRVTTHVLKMATRFEKLASRKIGKKWTAAQANAASKMAATFHQIADAIKSGNQEKTDGLLDKAWSTAQAVFGGNQKSLAGMSHALTAIDTANDKGLLRAVAADIEDDEDEWGDEDETWLDEFEADLDEQVTLSRIAEAMANIGEQLAVLRAQNVTPEEEAYEQRTQEDTEDKVMGNGDIGRGLGANDRGGPQPEYQQSAERADDRTRAVSAEYRRWREKALKAVSSGKPSFAFVSDIIPREMFHAITAELQRCTTADDVRAVFARAREGDGNPKAPASVSGGNQPLSKSAWKLRW